MTRVWRHLGVSILCAVLLVVLSQCKGLKPTAGQPCTIGNNRYQCTDPNTALLCQNGRWVNMPCRGSQGCTSTGTKAHCDDDLAQAGDACLMVDQGDNLACGVDKSSELICASGTWKTRRSCKGPKKCTITMVGIDGTINCDDTLADVGDACVVESGDNNYACSTDKKNETVCDAASSKFVAVTPCRGGKGCFEVEPGKLFCDRSVSRIGEKCRTADEHACSEDTTEKLKCSPQLTWVKDRDCKRVGCKVKWFGPMNREILCDNY